MRGRPRTSHRRRMQEAANAHPGGPIGRTPQPFGGDAAAVRSLCGVVVFGAVRDHPKDARGMRHSSLSTDDEGGGAAWCLEVRGCGLSQRVNKPVGSLVGGGEACAIPLRGFSNGSVGLVRRHPHQLATGDQGGDVITDDVRNSYASKSPSAPTTARPKPADVIGQR